MDQQQQIGGGGGDASAANQTLQIAEIEKLSVPLVWGTRTQVTANDSGTINIPANVNRRGVKFFNEKNGEDFWYALGGETPVAEEDEKVKKEQGVYFGVGEAGTAAIIFICKSGKTTIITYQEAT